MPLASRGMAWCPDVMSMYQWMDLTLFVCFVGSVCSAWVMVWSQIAEKRAIQCKGGTNLGEAHPTWTKQKGDTVVNYVGLALCVTGIYQLIVGHYRLATGKGKME
jgi:hypothetical protein